MNNKWNIDFWEKNDGKCYLIKEFIEPLKKNNKVLLKNLFSRMDRYVGRPMDDLILINDLEKIDNDLWELKFHTQNEIRFLGYKEGILVFYAFCGFIKKDQRIRNYYIESAKKRLIEFKKEKNIK
ncbi:hypothetical protein M0R01_00735 [bacterium]|nr:hypothetical protein [bacterium]